MYFDYELMELLVTIIDLPLYTLIVHWCAKRDMPFLNGNALDYYARYIVCFKQSKERCLFQMIVLAF